MNDDVTDIFSVLYLTERFTCLPEALLEDEVLRGIHTMFSAVLEGVRDELVERRATPHDIWILVDPSSNDTTAFALTTAELVLFRGQREAWSLSWESMEEMARELEQWYRTAEQRLAPASNRKPMPAGPPMP